MRVRGFDGEEEAERSRSRSRSPRLGARTADKEGRSQANAIALFIRQQWAERRWDERHSDILVIMATEKPAQK